MKAGERTLVTVWQYLSLSFTDTLLISEKEGWTDIWTTRWTDRWKQAARRKTRKRRKEGKEGANKPKQKQNSAQIILQSFQITLTVQETG